LEECTHLRNGVALVTGPTGSGKSSTLAAILGLINEQQAYHIITIEDPI
jgi:twitching motility protein PilT